MDPGFGQGKESEKSLMMTSNENIGFLVDEYDGLFAKVKDDSIDSYRELLVSGGDWSDQAASHLLQLVKNNGAFILRNALAISMALGIEDGDLGF